MDKKILQSFIQVTRIPFFIPGIMPFLLGVALAFFNGASIDAGFFLLSFIGLAAILALTYHTNEYTDFPGDAINAECNQFSGGSRAIVDKLIERRHVFYLSLIDIVILGIVLVLYLLFYFAAYPALLWMGLLGAFLGVFYVVPPFKFAYHGFGEILIGFAYGILAVISGYYVLAAQIDTLAFIVAIPASLSVFAVIFINEFPDYTADKAVQKNTLVVRLGKEASAPIYIAAIAATYGATLPALFYGFTPWILITSLVLLPIVAANVRGMLKKQYNDHKMLEGMCARGIALNALASLVFILAIIIEFLYPLGTLL